MATKAVTDSSFKADVIDSDKPVLVDFWAEWCGPCKQFAPVIEKVCAEYESKGVKLVKVNVDENGFIASQFRVQSIPTVYAVFQGQPVADLSQARTEGQLKQYLDQLLGQLPIESDDKALAQEVARKGVTVNCIAPGYIDTDMVAAVPPAVLEKIVAKIPVGRLGQASEIARGVAFLCSEDAGFVTGTTLSLNGGQHMY